MYAYLRGTLAVKGRDFVALDCGGVGYKIFVTEGYLQACKIGEEATLYTHLVVREEELSLSLIHIFAASWQSPPKRAQCFCCAKR